MDQQGRERFGAYLKSIRDAHGLSQKKAAELARVSSPYLAQVEKGQRNPPNSDILCRLARVYGIPEQKVLQEAGYLEGGLNDVPEEVIERAFKFVCEDPSFTFATRLQGRELPLDAKALIVEIYQQAQHRILLTSDELEMVQPKEE